MENLLEQETPVVTKVKELCTEIVNQPGFGKIIKDMETFMSDPEAQKEYEKMRTLQENLQARQQAGQDLTDEEIDGFNQARDRFFENDICRNFVNAQQQMGELQQTVTQYVTKTFEIGRVPEEADFASCGGCGGGCGCG